MWLKLKRRNHYIVDYDRETLTIVKRGWFGFTNDPTLLKGRQITSVNALWGKGWFSAFISWITSIGVINLYTEGDGDEDFNLRHVANPKKFAEALEEII